MMQQNLTGGFINMKASDFFRIEQDDEFPDFSIRSAVNIFSPMAIPVPINGTHHMLQATTIAAAGVYQEVFSLFGTKGVMQSLAWAQTGATVTGEQIFMKVYLGDTDIWSTNFSGNGDGTGMVIFGSLLSTGDLLGTAGYKYYEDITIQIKTTTSTGTIGRLLMDYYWAF